LVLCSVTSEIDVSTGISRSVTQFGRAPRDALWCSLLGTSDHTVVCIERSVTWNGLVSVGQIVDDAVSWSDQNTTVCTIVCGFLALMCVRIACRIAG
jgi:hypothetical protein